MDGRGVHAKEVASPKKSNSRLERKTRYPIYYHNGPKHTYISSNDRGYSFERNCVLRRWESETLK